MGRIVPTKKRKPISNRNLAVGGLLVAIAAVLTFAALRNASQQMNANQSAVGLGNQVAVGKGIYAQYCASCHGANLEGQPNWRTPLANGSMPAPPHDITGHTWHHGDQYLFDVTKFGGQASSPEGYVNAMPAFGNQLSDTEIQSVLAYIKSTWPADIQAAQQSR
jgi:mono/diheme cytochrome c family protein